MGPDADPLFRGAFEAVPDAVLVIDGDGRIVLANAHCETVFGYAPARLLGRAVEMLVPLRFRDGHDGRRAAYAAEPDPRPMGLLRLSAVRADGSEFPAEISLAPIRSGGVEYVAATVRDITARVREEERFRSLLEAAPDPTVIVEAGGEIVLVNDRVHDVFGYRPEELLGRPLSVLAADVDRERTASGFAAYVAAPSEVAMGTIQLLRVRHRDGHDLPVEVSMAPLRTAEGTLVSIAVRDVSARLRMEARSQAQRDALIATVSHELRTPLTSIIGYIELLADLGEEDLSRRSRKLLGVIERNALRELQLVDDLLTVAYLDDDRVQLRAEPVALAEVCRRVVDDHALQARERGLDLVLVDDEEVDAVRGDVLRLTQVVGNLVSNAVKFTRPGGRIEVWVRAERTLGLVEVRDTGIGVPSEERARLFERLYRARGAIELEAPGAGLGLSIARAIVEAHGGWVDLESEPGVGTVVRIAIPYAEPPEERSLSGVAPAAG